MLQNTNSSPYPFFKGPRLPRTCRLLFNACWYFVYTIPKSDIFFISLPCRICRFKLRWSSRCNITTSVCLFIFDGCFMEWPNVLSMRWHVILDIFCVIWFWGQKCDDTKICLAFSISFLQKEIYKKLHASARLLTIYMIMQFTGVIFIC